ncbi:BMP family ABC transporter substrate-binding protein [Blautia sp.]|uniref:Purine-binding protein n=1 Tax=Blautia glucerasea TaxID=536633 RepID=A0A6N2TF24_9FIRM|nr:BMP family ABC transporter substrate-binding protein [uncultured Blautia sp.]
MKKSLFAAAALAGALTLTAIPVMADEPDYASMKIVLILPGSIDDQSWNASNNAGAKACDEALGTSIEVVESVPVEEFEATFTEYGEKGYDLVMSAGSQFDEACAAVAPGYPETTFTVINGQVSETENMVPVFPKEYEGSYLAGIVAGYATENGKFAVMGGESNAPMVKLMDTYEAAALGVCEERGIEGAEANRSFLNTWTDVSITKSMTDQMIDNGADTVFCYSNEGASGAVQSAEEKGATFVAFAANKNEESDCVAASLNMNWAGVYPWIIEGVAKGELTGAQQVGVKEGVFEALLTDNITDECKAAVEKAIEDISAGNVDFESMFSE